MDAGRLVSVLSDVVAEAAAQNLTGTTQQLVSAVQNVITQPTNPSHEQQFKNFLAQLESSLQVYPSNSWPPSRRQILETTGLSEVIGIGLRKRMDAIFATNRLLRNDALQQLQALSAEQQKKISEATNVVTLLGALGVAQPQLPTDGVEVGFLLPNQIATATLRDAQKELKFIDQLLAGLSELSGESGGSAKLIGVNSGSLLAFVFASYKVSDLLLKIVERVLGIWQTTIDLRRQEIELKRMQVPESVTKPLQAHIEQTVTVQIETYVQELVDQSNIADAARKHELRNRLSMSVKVLADHIDRGARVEASVKVIAAPPQATEQDLDFQDVVRAAQLTQDIAARGALMRDTPQLEKPILTLPETIAVEEPPEAKTPPIVGQDPK